MKCNTDNLNYDEIPKSLNNTKENSFWQEIMELKPIYQIILIVFILILFAVILYLIIKFKSNKSNDKEKLGKKKIENNSNINKNQEVENINKNNNEIVLEKTIELKDDVKVEFLELKYKPNRSSDNHCVLFLELNYDPNRYSDSHCGLVIYVRQDVIVINDNLKEFLKEFIKNLNILKEKNIIEINSVKCYQYKFNFNQFNQILEKLNSSNVYLNGYSNKDSANYSYFFSNQYNNGVLLLPSSTFEIGELIYDKIETKNGNQYYHFQKRFIEEISMSEIDKHSISQSNLTLKKLQSFIRKDFIKSNNKYNEDNNVTQILLDEILTYINLKNYYVIEEKNDYYINSDNREKRNQKNIIVKDMCKNILLDCKIRGYQDNIFG